MHAVAFLQDLAVVMIVAAVVTLVFHRLRQPVVLGYILAGFIIGPHTPPFSLVHEEETIRSLSELGIIFLMFSLGLEFNLRKLKQVGATAFLAASLEIVLLLGAGYQLGRFFGWGVMDSLFLGAMLSISSTTIIIKALAELRLNRERFAGLIFGILIIEDILAIVMIALLSGIAMTGGLGAGEVGLTLGRLAVFLAAALVLGLIAVPRLLGYVGRAHSNEMLLITVLGLCFGVSLLAVKLGYSVALGAFLIGAVISEAREIGRIEHLTEPLRDMFSAVFFVSIGLLIDPRLLLEHAWPITAITITVVVGKIFSCALGTFIAGNDLRTSLRVGMGLAQIGEFSFIIAALGLSLNVTSGFLYPIGVAVSAITTLLTPYLIRSADGMASWIGRRALRPLTASLDTYTRWVGQLGAGRPASLPRRLVRRWAWQMALNLLLIAAVFVVAAFLVRRPPAWLPDTLARPAAYRSLLWLAATILTLPLQIATFRKLQALGMLVAELRVTEAAAGPRTAAIRGVVAQVFSLAGLGGLVLFGLALSTPLLPPLNILLVLAIVLALLTALLWRPSIRVYARAQGALGETFAQPPHPRPAHGNHPVAGLLREADLETVSLTPGCFAAGRLLRDLALRAETGASLIALERDGSPLVNPPPDQELRPGDQVLLLGTADQLAAARKHLLAPAAG